VLRFHWWRAGRQQVFGTTCNKSVELNDLVPTEVNCQQAVDNLSTSWEQAVRRTDPVDKLLELLQVCCMFVTTCAFSYVCSSYVKVLAL
jgi:hypothetical protein